MAKKPDIEATVEVVQQAAPEKPAKKEPAALKMRPSEWAEKLGRVVKGDPRMPQSKSFPDMAHAVADKLHGWSAHEHHYQSSPLLITQADYEAAREAGGGYPVTPAHEPALSPVKRPKEMR